MKTKGSQDLVDCKSSSFKGVPSSLVGFEMGVTRGESSSLGC